MGLNLFESDNNIECEDELKINKKYAERYEKWRKKEELQKLKDKYSDEDLSDDDDSQNSSSSEDEESDEADEDEIFDEKFLKVYGALKRKDRSIYNKEVKFYLSDEEDKTDKTENSDSVKGQRKEQKRLKLIDYHRKLIKERKGITEEDEDKKDLLHHSKTYHQELEQIKDEFKNILNEDDDQGGNLIKIVKKKDEEPLNPQDLLKKAADADDDIKFLDIYWNSKELDEREEFLKQYVLGRKYMPSKNEFNKTSDEEFEDSKSNDEQKEKEKEMPKVSETKYHFQEVGSEKIKRYPRNVNSVRDLVFGSFKSIKRVSVKERKRKEKRDELQRLRNLKREEIKEKLMKIKQITGNEDILKNVDVDMLVDETDFDPENYDRIMNNLFGKKYYDAPNSDAVKPVFEFIEGIDSEDEGIPGEGFLKDGENEVLTKKSKKEKKVKQSGRKDIGIYEDIIGGVPTRFKYREVQSNDFGLTAEELIFSTDQELNQWVSLKKTCQYSSDKEEQDLLRNYSCKRNDIYLKRKIFKSIYSEPKQNLKESESPINEEKMKKKKKRRGKSKAKNNQNKEEINTIKKTLVNNKIDEQNKHKSNNNDQHNKIKENYIKNKQIKKNRSRKRPKDKNLDIDRNRLKAYGLTNREIKRRKLL